MWKKYEYENATIYITKPTVAHTQKVRKATEIFLNKIVKESNKDGQRKK